MQLPNNKILLVDDNIDFATTLSTLLIKYGYDCEVCYSKEEALKCYKNNFSIFILDISLGADESGGVDLLKELKSYKPMSSVIMITGNQSYDHLVHCISLGASDFFIKSKLDKEYIINTIEREVQKQRNWLSVMANMKKKEDVFDFREEEGAPSNYSVAVIAGGSGLEGKLYRASTSAGVKCDTFTTIAELSGSEHCYNLIFLDWAEECSKEIFKLKQKWPFAEFIICGSSFTKEQLAACCQVGVFEYINEENPSIVEVTSLIKSSIKRNRLLIKISSDMKE